MLNDHLGILFCEKFFQVLKMSEVLIQAFWKKNWAVIDL